MQERTDEFAVLPARAITRRSAFFHSAAPVPFDVVADGCAASMRPTSTAIAGDTDFDPTAATELGVARARDGGTAVDCDGGGKASAPQRHTGV